VAIMADKMRWMEGTGQEATGDATRRLAAVVAALRAPDGCPWDREQTHASLRPYLLEETYEVLAALDDGDGAALREELGDLLLQIVLHAQIATETGAFDLADVAEEITAKLVRRHPHVFGDAKAHTAHEVRARWEALKQEERAARGVRADPLAGVPAALPALARAQTVQDKAARLGAVVDGMAPSAPVLAALASGGRQTGVDSPDGPPSPAGVTEERSREIGAALWSVVSLARAWGVDAESALREATARFQTSLADDSPAAEPPADARSPARSDRA